MNEEMVVRNNPLRLESLASFPLSVAVGEAETKAFHEQSKSLYEGWKEKRSNIQFLSLSGRHHFSIVETMID